MISLAIVETRRSWRLFLRYPTEAIAVFVILSLLFAGLFLGASYLAGPQRDFGARMDSIIVGYVAWLLVLGIFSGIAGEIEQEAKAGTLEQLALSDRSFLLISVIRVLANLTINLLITLTVLACILWLTGARIAFTSAVLPSIGLLTVGATGLGLIMGAIALLMKKTTALIGLMQLVLLFMVFLQSAPGGEQSLQWQDVIPLSSSVAQMRAILTTEYLPSAADHLIPAINALTYLVIGCALFVWAYRKAKCNGTLGHY
jgi:ABC-2 type transport system permease protein